jgi:sugar phosphate isomerase/epimerase
MNRRSFIMASAAFLGGSALVSLGCGRSAIAAPAIKPGVQLYTLRDVMADNVEGTLEQLVAMGYSEVETHTYYGLSPAEMRAMLDRVGLAAPAAHVGSGALQQDLDSVIESAATLGHAYVFCPHPGGLPYQTLDDYRAMGEFFDGVGARFREAGITFGYHNHQFEFEPVDGEIPLFAMLDNADPQNLVLEMDLFWTVDGGYDPVEVIRRYPGRIPAYHVKDRTLDGAMVDVGAGDIDFARIFQHNGQAGLRHAFVEHDNPADSLQSVRASIDTLNSLLG